jgi:ubiquinone/menaquinone biosynthesis C-methylase UbiE
MESLEIINQKTKITYNKVGQKYFDLFCDELENKEFDKKFFNNFAKYFDSNSLVCDVGCGPCGHVADYLQKKGINVIGIDISDKCIEIAQSHHPSIHFETGDISNLKFSEDYLDGIIAYYSIIDTPKIYVSRIIKEFNRVLRKGGLLALVVKEGNSEGYQDELLGINTQIYFSLFTKIEIESYLLNNEFKILSLEERSPQKDEIKINRIYSISKKK